jgi:hypothetical protein
LKDVLFNETARTTDSFLARTSVRIFTNLYKNNFYKTRNEKVIEKLLAKKEKKLTKFKKLESETLVKINTTF